ncbi:MAG: hypothetical protein ACI4U5_01595 [Bacilli bacterium]
MKNEKGKRIIKNLIFCILIFICFVLIIPCSRISNAKDYASSEKKINSYYTIEVAEYARLKDGVEGSFYVFLSLPTYYYYLVKTTNNEYITVAVKDKKHITSLEESQNGVLSSIVRITGKLKNNIIDINYYDFDIDEEGTIISSYFIEEKSTKPYEYGLPFAYFISLVFFIVNFITESVRKSGKEEYHTLDSYMKEKAILETKLDFIKVNNEEYEFILANKKIEALWEILYIISSCIIFAFINIKPLILCAFLILFANVIFLFLNLSNRSKKLSFTLYKYFKLKNLRVVIEQNKEEVLKVEARIKELDNI